MIIGLGSVFLTIGLILYDAQIKKNKKLQKQKKKAEVIRLCLTGGPCGGKSEGISMLYNSLKKITVPVFIVPQAATIIGSAGINLDLSKFTPRQIQLFQIYLMRLQLNLQNLMTKVGRNFINYNKKSVVLCDRGLLDGKAYAGDENWAKMLDQIKITEEEIVDRYEAVIHMVTAAQGAAQHYNLGNAVRHQTVDFAVQLDRKIQRCYKDHPSRYLITNQFIVSNFQEKKNVLLVQVYQILLKLIQQNNVVNYYQDFMKKMQEDDENDQANSKINPFLLRKIKFKQYLKRKTDSKEFDFQKINNEK